MPIVINALGWTLLHSLWEGLFLWLALRAGLVLLAKRSAQARYLIACAALFTALVAFLATFFQMEALALRAPAGGSPPLAPSQIMPPVVGIGSLPPAGDARGRLQAGIATVFPWIVLAWALGCGWGVVRLSLAWRAARQLAQSIRLPGPGELTIRCQVLLRRFGIRQLVRIGESALVDGPCVVGWVKPLILVPFGAFAGLTPAQVDGLIAHELAHIARHDFAVNVLQSICEVVLFYHPAIHAISRSIRRERENACDDRAVEATGDRRAYAAALAQLEVARQPGLSLAAQGESGLVERVRRLLDSAPPIRRHSSFGSPLAGLGLVVVLALLFSSPLVGIRLLARQVAPMGDAGPASRATRAPVEDDYPYVLEVTLHQPTWARFAPGDSILVTSLRGDRPRVEPGGNYVVEGTYSLASIEGAWLSVSVTAESSDAPGAVSPVHREEGTAVDRGTGEFALRMQMRYPGAFHVSFTPLSGGNSRGSIYFAESLPSTPADAQRASERVVIQIARDGAITWDDGQVVTREQLRGLLPAVYRRNPATSVRIQADPQTPFENVTRVMDLLRAAGLTKFDLQTR